MFQAPCGAGHIWTGLGAMAHNKHILQSKTQIQGQDTVSQLQRSRPGASLLQEAYPDHLPPRVGTPSPKLSR